MRSLPQWRGASCRGNLSVNRRVAIGFLPFFFKSLVWQSGQSAPKLTSLAESCGQRWRTTIVPIRPPSRGRATSFRRRRRKERTRGGRSPMSSTQLSTGWRAPALINLCLFVSGRFCTASPHQSYPLNPLLRPKREAYWALNTHAYVCRASPPKKEGDKTVAVHLRRVVKCSRKLLWEGGTAYEKRFWGGWLPLHGQPFYSWSTWTGSRWRCGSWPLHWERRERRCGNRNYRRFVFYSHITWMPSRDDRTVCLSRSFVARLHTSTSSIWILIPSRFILPASMNASTCSCVTSQLKQKKWWERENLERERERERERAREREREREKEREKRRE